MSGEVKASVGRTAFAVIHVPHSSTFVPGDVRLSLSLLDSGLDAELLAMTDRYTDELFALPAEVAATIVFPVSRLVVDPERFVDDEREPMTERGMGVIYTRTSRGERLRLDPSPEERRVLLDRYYHPHHAALARAVAAALFAHGCCLIIDAHSFPSKPLPYEPDQSLSRPDICIGTDSFHTPGWLAELAVETFREQGWRVEVNRPFSGSIVPMEFHGEDARVISVMIEVNRGLYMDERSGAKSPEFQGFRRRLMRTLFSLIARATDRMVGCKLSPAK